jgi:hypothetical protein
MDLTEYCWIHWPQIVGQNNNRNFEIKKIIFGLHYPKSGFTPTQPPTKQIQTGCLLMIFNLNFCTAV